MRKVSVLLTIVSLVALLVIGCSTSNDVFSPDTRLSFAPVVIPDGATIQSVTFNVYGSANGQNITLHRITSDWDETTVTFSNFGNAYDPTVVGSFLNDLPGWNSVDITALFLAWADGTYPNHGILMNQEIVAFSLATYFAREATTNHAYLEVCYELNGDIICEQTEVIEDTYITELNPNTNYGTLPVFYTGSVNDVALDKMALLQFEIEMTPPEEEGCSHTIGYWRTHAGFGPQDDVVSQYLPILLGNFIVSDNQIAYDVLKQHTYGDPSNGITKLMAQLLGTKLSIADGASDGAVASAIADADAFLSSHTWMDWESLSDSERADVIALKDMFDNFNNGYIGPGHCDEFNETHDYCNEIDGSHLETCPNYVSGGDGKGKDKPKKRGN